MRCRGQTVGDDRQWQAQGERRAELPAETSGAGPPRFGGTGDDGFDVVVAVTEVLGGRVMIQAFEDESLQSLSFINQ